MNQENNKRLSEVKYALKDVVDPELGINIVDLGLVYKVHFKKDLLIIDLTLTSVACPLTDVIEDGISEVMQSFLLQKWKINWVWDPPWTPEKMSTEGKEQMRALGFSI